GVVAALSLVLTPRLRPILRVLVAVAVTAVAVVIILRSASIAGLNGIDDLFTTFEDTRAALMVGARTAITGPTISPDAPLVVRTLSYLPTGLGYAIFAPVPLLSSRLQERLAAPEMLVWYVLLLSAAVTL